MSGGARNVVDNLREDPTPLPFALMVLLPESESFSRLRGGARNYVGHYHFIILDDSCDLYSTARATGLDSKLCAQI
jgi:hypothetical protein